MPELPPGTQPRILCYGDSLTAGLTGNFVLQYTPYAKTLSKLMGCDVDYVGLSGWTTQQMVEIAHDKTATDVKDRQWKDAGLAYRLQKAYKKNKAYTCVIIMAGTNDLGDLPPEKIAANLMTLHNYVRDSGAVSVACAIPKHGALVSQHYGERMGEASVKRLKKLVHNANLAIKAAVQVTNDQGTDACQITYVDVHHEMLKWCGDSEEDIMKLYAGFPTLGEYRDFMLALCEQRELDQEDLAKMKKNFEEYTEEDIKKRIDETKEGKRIKKSQPQHYASLEDALHFSSDGYKIFAEALHSKVFARDGGRTARDRRSGGGSGTARSSKRNSAEDAAGVGAALVEAHRPQRTRSFNEKGKESREKEGKEKEGREKLERRSQSMRDVNKDKHTPDRHGKERHHNRSSVDSEAAARTVTSPTLSSSSVGDLGTPSNRATPEIAPMDSSCKSSSFSPESPGMAWKAEEKERGRGLFSFMLKSRDSTGAATSPTAAPTPDEAIHYGCIPNLHPGRR